jgi:hypothetical protein
VVIVGRSGICVVKRASGDSRVSKYKNEEEARRCIANCTIHWCMCSQGRCDVQVYIHEKMSYCYRLASFVIMWHVHECQHCNKKILYSHLSYCYLRTGFST